MAETEHVPVMAEEVVEYLAPQPGAVIVDCTLGAGGHSRRLAARMGRGRLFGFDKDPDALALAEQAMEGRQDAVEFVAQQGDFAAAPEQLRARGVEQVDGVVADLGMSSMQLRHAQRGFSFAADGPLDMRMNPRQALTAEQVVNQFDERTLADLIFQFGDERRSRRIARAIVRSRPLRGTRQLAELVAAAAGSMKARPGLHPATRTFQALRIYVNSELESLTQLLAALPGWLRPGGRAVIIAFHSLEDRPVKQSFRAGAQAGWYQLLTPHAARPSGAEVAANPRARSARLRAIARTGREGYGDLLPAAN